MKPIEEVYPDAGEYGWFLVYDYGPLLESLGYDIVIQVDDDGYEGDSRLLLRNGNEYGVLIFGWGSCSGCDALQACDSAQEVEELRNKLISGIHWEPSAGAMLRYVEEKDWEIEWAWHAGETKKFIEQVKEHLHSGD